MTKGWKKLNWKSQVSWSKNLLFSAIVVTSTLNSIAWHLLTLVSYIPNEFYDSGGSIAHIEQLWPGLASLKIANFNWSFDLLVKVAISAEMEVDNGSSKSIPKFEFSKSTLFEIKINNYRKMLCLVTNVSSISQIDQIVWFYWGKMHEN